MSTEAQLDQPPATEVHGAEVGVPPKPLINPLQRDAPPPSSTIVEPPRSPNAANPGAGPTAPTTPALEATSAISISASQPNGTAVLDAEMAEAPTTSATAEPFPGAGPTPVGTVFDPIASAPPTAPGSNHSAMDVDGEGSPSSVGVKRAGDDLAADDAKRIREDTLPSAPPPPPAPTPVFATPASAPAPPVAVASEPAPAPAPMSTPAAPTAPGAPVAVNPAVAQPGVVYPWTNYQPTQHGSPGPTTPLTVTQHKYLLNTVRSLKKSKDAVNFLNPVDVQLFNIPHYPQVVDRPMDLGTVETKLVASDPRGPPKDKSKAAKWDTSKGSYANVAEVSEDVRQIWENTRKFNGRDHVVSYAATKLESTYERALKQLPAEPAPPPMAPPQAVASPAGPSARRQSISQTPVIRREPDSGRPKRDIHPPPSKDINYDSPGSQRKPKRRNDPQLQWAQRTINGLERTQKYFEIVSPFLYPIGDIIAAIPEYTQIVKKPIDLHVIKQRLEDGAYDDVSQIDADMRLLANNARTFNPVGHAVHNAAIAFLQIWDEKYRTVPPKQSPRHTSEDMGDEMDDSDDDDKDVARLREARSEKAALEREIADLEDRIARKPKRKPKVSKPKPAPRKYSTSSKASPGAANGAPKKVRKPKEPSYRDDDDDSEDELQTISITQQEELAEKILSADADTLQQAIQIIQTTLSLPGDQEIELDMNSLPPATVLKLYNLVCRGRKRGGKKAKPAPRRSGFGGAPGRKHLNEQEEADRIRKMEAQLQSFEGRGGASQAYDDEDSSEEEESSDEE